jgi:hypothetical protein
MTGRRHDEGAANTCVPADDTDDAATVCGGVRDTYGEDNATEEQLITPWAVSVAR